MPLITINGNSLDPIEQDPIIRSVGLRAVDASASNYLLIQTTESFSPKEKEELEALGVVFHCYVSENTYLCGYAPSDLAAVRSVDNVAWANVYLKQFKVAADLKPQTTSSSSLVLPLLAGATRSRTTRTVDITFHDDIDPQSDEVKTAIASAARTDKTTLEMGRYKVRLQVEERALNDLAEIDSVRAIQAVNPRKLWNYEAVKIMNAPNANSTNLQGEGQVIAVADTGFDEGKLSSDHPAFVNTKVVKLYALGRSGMANDPDGHGTHVCGSIAGSGKAKAGTPAEASREGVAAVSREIRGTAPKSTLVVQSLLDTTGGLGGIPTDLGDLFEPPYLNDGARVHTNSWGSSSRDGSQIRYDQSATEIDRFVWEHKDMVILFAAGNDGKDDNGNGVIDLGQIGSEASAKNCISVGASENTHSHIKTTYGDFTFTATPLRGDQIANNRAGMAAFSSRGPTKEKRFKPDVVAPGSAVLSARSLSSPPNTRLWSCQDPLWCYEAGTSMATPLVAGCVGVIRQALKDRVPNPSAALVKALLINGATELSGQYIPTEAGSSPNNNSGFGLVDLTNSIKFREDPRSSFREGNMLRVKQEDEIPITISKQGTFKITLVWSDPPGAELQNDLDLIVKTADGVERHGNMGTSPNFDRLNNVEQVVWTNMPPGSAKVIVRAFRLDISPQPYALAWHL